ncbi:MAG: hypothetical protein ABIG44_15520 [Planctomycetota bacterium]
MEPKDQYKIDAVPNARTVSRKSTCTYYLTCKEPGLIQRYDDEQVKYEWEVYYDRALVKAGLTTAIWKVPWSYHRGKTHRLKMWWLYCGLHNVLCVVQDPVLKHYVIKIRRQWVDTQTHILRAALGKLKDKKLPSPTVELNFYRRYIEVLQAAAKDNLPSQHQTKHKERMRQLRLYRDKLAERLKQGQAVGRERFPFKAVHLEQKTQRQSELRVCLVYAPWEIDEGRTWHYWIIIDWTNPTVRATTGVYRGGGYTHKQAIENALKFWKSDNRYPPGKLRYEIPAEIGGQSFEGEFETDGKSFRDELADFFNWVALGATIVAGVATFLAPVPGSRVVSGMIWMSLFSSTAAAVINIGQRHEEKFGSWKDDTFDALTIVGNIFTAGTMAAWSRGATLLVRGAKGQILKAVLVGQVATDAIQGVLLVGDAMTQYDQIMSDKSLSPEQRINKLVFLFGRVGLQGLVTYISVKGTARDLKNLQAGKLDTTKIKQLQNPDAEVDLTGKPKVKGHTKNRKLVTTAQDEQIRADSQKKVRSFKQRYPADDEFWRVRTITDNEIKLQHAHPDFPNNTDKDFMFHVKIDSDGYVDEMIRTRWDIDGNVTYSSKLRASECYEMMFEHFEQAGRKIKGFEACFAWDNYTAFKAQLDKNMSPKQAFLSSGTGKKYWKPWAERNGFELIVEETRHQEKYSLFHMKAKWVPKSGG